VVQLLRVAHVEAPEVDELAGRVDFGLKCRLRLPEHRRGIDRVAPGRGEQLCGPQQDGRAILERPGRPLTAGRHGGLDGHLHVLRLGHVPVSQHVLVLEGHHGLPRLAGANLLAADDQRNLDTFAGHRRQAGLQ
jgi:hypothetical protein